ncbi:serine/arginine repetitive matrix protein 2 [Nocardioides sp. NBC_00368]|uniref:serine/arginine repetitive matrix protein 2 n=1 Tax=Nocardioides sp. NBC_00368 TaxID=2976000 RepID=UPI002E1E996A
MTSDVVLAPFTTPEGLRALLTRLHDAGEGSWVDDPEAAELVRYTIDKYAALARRHRQEPEDAASAAYEVMLTSAARNATDPWAVVTRAVQITMIAEERAEGLLCSTMRARRAEMTAYHDAERFSDRENPVYDYHPAFRWQTDEDELLNRLDGHHDLDGPGTGAYVAADMAVAIFVAFGWPEDSARATIDCICGRLTVSGSRPTAHQTLRRDHAARAALDLDRRSWATTLRIVLGSPNPERAQTASGRGLLQRLALGFSPQEVLDDDQLVVALSRTATQVQRGPAHV